MSLIPQQNQHRILTTSSTTTRPIKQVGNEFRAHVAGKDVLCASISFYRYDPRMMRSLPKLDNHYLPMNFTEEDFEQFIKKINIIVDIYETGTMENTVVGTIWYKDLTWSTIGEAAYSGMWQHHAVPEIPFQCFRKTSTTSNEEKDNSGSDTGNI